MTGACFERANSTARLGLGRYVDRIGQIGRITPEQERRLSDRIAVGRAPEAEAAAREDAAVALHALVEANLRLVVAVARRYPTHTTVDLSDLIQAGNQGLLWAAETFDGRRGFRFSTYATKWIQQAIGRLLDGSATGVRVPLDKVNAARRAIRMASAAAETLSEDVREIVPFLDTASLDQPVGEGGITLGDLQADLEQPFERAVADADERKWVRALVASLPEQHAAALRLRHGLDGGQPASYLTIARNLSISERQARKVVGEASERLREVLGEGSAERHTNRGGVPCPVR